MSTGFNTITSHGDAETSIFSNTNSSVGLRQLDQNGTAPSAAAGATTATTCCISDLLPLQLWMCVLSHVGQLCDVWALTATCRCVCKNYSSAGEH
jgi:hypothetical protein